MFVAKNSPLAAEALRKFKAGFGFDVAEVLPDDHWAVALLNGRPEVILNAKGLRSVALMSPRPDAQQVVEAVINHAPGMPRPVGGHGDA